MTPAELAEKISTMFSNAADDYGQWKETVVSVESLLQAEFTERDQRHQTALEEAVDKARAVGHAGCKKEAYEEGRKAGLESAAQIVETTAVDFTFLSVRDFYANKIRRQAEEHQ